MTRSTGVRERQRRREELFGAEIKLHRVLLHLAESRAWSLALPDRAEYGAQCFAYATVIAAFNRVMAEWKALD